MAFLVLMIFMTAVIPTASAQLLRSTFPRIERVCDDRLDNDSDGTKDCTDADCATSPACIDADGDKYPVTKDCNDFDPNVHPDAVEKCNSIDDDCDSLIDDADSSVIGLLTFYADGDADTYGTASTTKTACLRPAGYVSNDDDCDDGDSAVKPGAVEVCNHKDDDCDSLTDSADDGITGQTTFYADADGDTHGDASSSRQSCEVAEGYVVTSDDCDDTKGDVHPDATEACADDADNDCDGSADCDDTDCSAEKVCLSPWPFFHGNRQHTGESPYNGPQTATVRWSYKFSEMTTGGTSGGYAAPKNFAIDRDNRVFTNASSTVIAFNGGDGDVLWSKSVGQVGSVGLSNDQSVLYAVADSDMYALDADTGKDIWVFTDPTSFCHGEVVVAEDDTIYIASGDTFVYAVNPDGTLKWKFESDGSFAPMTSPSLSPDESVVYVGSGDPNYNPGGTLYALTAADGSVLWDEVINPPEDLGRASGAVVDAKGYIYVAGKKGNVTKFASDGTEVWQSDENTAAFLTPGYYSGGIVYAGTGGDGKVYAINASDGTTMWSYQTGKNPDAEEGNSKDPPFGVLTAPVIGADGTLYIGAMSNYMYALKTDGTLLWSYQAGENIDENCPAIGADGTLYFSSGDGYIYAIKDE